MPDINKSSAKETLQQVAGSSTANQVKPHPPSSASAPVSTSTEKLISRLKSPDIAEEVKQIERSEEQSERVASEILSTLDWNGQLPLPKASFSPFTFFCSKSLLKPRSNLQAAVALLEGTDATRMRADGTYEQGQTWQITDQKLADAIASSVAKDLSGAYLGVDHVVITSNKKVIVARVVQPRAQ